MNIQSMILKFIVSAIPLVSAVYIFVGIKLFRNKVNKDISFFSLLLFAVAIYSFGYYLELNSATLDTMLAFRDFEYLGSILIPTLGILFVSELTKTKISKLVTNFLFAISIVLWTLYITNPIHHFVHKSVEMVLGEYTMALTVKGPGYYILLVYVAVFVVCSEVMLFKAYKTAEEKSQRKSYFFILVTFQVPWISIVIIVLGLDKYIDFFPANIMLMCGLFIINEMKNDMFNVAKNRWINSFNNIAEPAFLVDKSKEIVCSNLAANRFFSEQKKTISDVIESLDNSELFSEPIMFTIDSEIRWFDVKKNNYHSENNLINYLLIDITAKKNAYLVSLAFFNSIEDFIFVATEDGKVLFVNNVVEKRLGYTIEEIKKMYIVDFHPKELKAEATEIFVKLLKHELDYCALPLQTKSGSNISVETRIWVGDWNGKSVVYGMSKDITLLNETFDKFEKSFMNNPAIMAISDMATRKYIDVNDAFVNKIGYTREELIGKTADEFGIFYNGENISKAINSIKNSGRFSDIEIDINTKNGDTLNGVFYGEIIKTESSTHLLTVMLDITERKKADDKILYLSYHDQLTGVYNRRYFDDEIDRLDDEQYFPLTLVMADVNGLKLTNDAFGHKVGDLLLQKIANILKSECRDGDVISRIGGDEFVLLLPNTNAENAEKIITRIQNAMKNDKVDNIILSISVGFALKQEASEDVNKVFKKAEDEMYKNKLSESMSMRSKTIDLIMNTLYEKNNREMLHSKRVSEICEAIATKMNFDSNEINQIKLAGLMHDIGKIGIAEIILNKPKELNKPEWREIERHCEIGYRILSSSNEFTEIADYVLQHHEKWNGKGYPRGLKGEEISVQARIVSVADAFDAISYGRTYSKPLSPSETLEEMKKSAGVQFDPDITRVLIEEVLGKAW